MGGEGISKSRPRGEDSDIEDDESRSEEESYYAPNSGGSLVELSYAGDIVESESTFKGLIGLYDSPRVEFAGAVKQCHQAGIFIQMPTEDNPGRRNLLVPKPAN